MGISVIGESSRLIVGTVFSLAPNDLPTVEVVGTGSNQTINFGIPEGVQGIQGIPGDPAFHPFLMGF